MKLPETIYVWDEHDEPMAQRSLNIQADGSRPIPETGDRIRAGVYKLVREVELAVDVVETDLTKAVVDKRDVDKREVDPTPVVDSWVPSSI